MTNVPPQRKFFLQTRQPKMPLTSIFTFSFVYLAKLTSYKCVVDGLVLSSVADPIDTRDAAGVASLLVSASVTQSAMQTSSLYIQLRSPLAVDGGILQLPIGTKARITSVISGSQSTVSAASSTFHSNPYYNSAIAQSQEDMKYIVEWEVRSQITNHSSSFARD